MTLNFVNRFVDCRELPSNSQLAIDEERRIKGCDSLTVIKPLWDVDDSTFVNRLVDCRELPSSSELAIDEERQIKGCDSLIVIKLLWDLDDGHFRQ